MSFVNYSTREVNVKMVYLPTNCGSLVLDALSYIYARTDPDSRSRQMAFPVEGGMVKFFDFVPLREGRIANRTARLHLYGTSSLTKGVRQVLSGADGAAIVVDASNVETAERDLSGLCKVIATVGFDEAIPLVFQLDGGHEKDRDSLKERLHLDSALCCDTETAQGVGVIDTARQLWGAIRARPSSSEE